MSDDELGFLRAAAERPADDLPRLVYADWHDDRGTPESAARAEFIRTQVKRSRLSPFDPDRASLLDREAELLRKFGRKWNGPLHRLLFRLGLVGKVDGRRAPIRGWAYHRGMVGRVTVTADALATTPDLVFAVGPVAVLRVIGWQTGLNYEWGWWKSAAETCAPQLGRLTAVAASAGHRHFSPLPDGSRFEWLRAVPLLDLRRFTVFGPAVQPLSTAARRGELSSVILYRTGSPTDRGRLVTRVIDPFGKWAELRPAYADLTGELVDAER